MMFLKVNSSHSQVNSKAQKYYSQINFSECFFLNGSFENVATQNV